MQRGSGWCKLLRRVGRRSPQSRAPQAEVVSDGPPRPAVSRVKGLSDKFRWYRESNLRPEAAIRLWGVFVGGRELLFQVKQTYTEDDLEIVRKTEKKKFRLSKAKVLWFRVSAMAGVLGLITLSGSIIWKTITMCEQLGLMLVMSLTAVWGLTFIFVPACILLLKMAFPGEGAKKSSDENELVFSFEEDHFTFSDGRNEGKMSYSSLEKFIEKDEHFLLYVDAGCFPLRKTCFVVGSPEEFGPFMREKYRTKDMDTPEKGLDET